MKLIVGITGGSGVIYALSLMKVLKELDVQIHLIVSNMGVQVAGHECGVDLDELKSMADCWYANDDMFSAISSGSFKTDGMIVVPCSMKTLSAVANGYTDSLIARAADVCLKERRRLIIVPRETPYNEIHLENMLSLCRMGAVIMPASPPFYNHPENLADIVRSMVGRILDQAGVEHSLLRRWGE